MAHWKQRETFFSEYELTVTLPGRWQMRPSGDPAQWLYRSAEKHKEHVTLIREETDALIGQEEAAYQKIIQRRRRAIELGFGRNIDLTLSPLASGERAGGKSFAFRGEAPALGHRFEALFLCQPRTVWTLVYDAFRLTPEQVEDRTQVIFASIVMEAMC
ncbi:MAG: hypothetical protein ACFUZC_01270 [Chthoniobacteraceae bacterium]